MYYEFLLFIHFDIWHINSIDFFASLFHLYILSCFGPQAGSRRTHDDSSRDVSYGIEEIIPMKLESIRNAGKRDSSMESTGISFHTRPVLYVSLAVP